MGSRQLSILVNESKDQWKHIPHPLWHDDVKYRFATVSRHSALKAEWEAKGRPQLQYKWRDLVGEFMDVPENNLWH